MIIIYSPRFASMYRKLPLSIKRLAEERETVFRREPFNPSLNTHKLQGRLNGLWAFSIDYRHRIIFEFANKNLVYFHSVGTHEIYK